MNALRNDVTAQLQANGAEVLQQSGGPHEGFHFDYKVGKSMGTLTILPLTIDTQCSPGDSIMRGHRGRDSQHRADRNLVPKTAGYNRGGINDSIR